MAKHKELSWLNEALLGFLLPKALNMGGDAVLGWLEKAYADDPVLVKTATVSLYPLIDVYVEKFAEQTETKLDDKAVDEVLETIEKFANNHAIQLPNLDAD